MIGLVIAGIALAVSFVALYIALREHAEFMKQLKARARFELTARTLNAGEGNVLHVPAANLHTTVRVEIGLKNVGDKAAGTTTINVVAPASLRAFRLVDSLGVPIAEPSPDRGVTAP